MPIVNRMAPKRTAGLTIDTDAEEASAASRPLVPERGQMHDGADGGLHVLDADPFEP